MKRSPTLFIANNFERFIIFKRYFWYIKNNYQLKMIFELGWAALAAIFTFSIAMVVWGRNGDGSIDIQFINRLFK